MARLSRSFAALLALALFVSHPIAAQSAELPVVEAEAVGMSTARLARISALTRRYVDEGKLAGSVVLVARDGKIAYLDATGTADLNTGAPMRPDTLFRIYSMTKPITAVAAMILYEEGRFQLNDPISKFLPELATLEVLNEDGTRTPAGPITMQQLLTHTAGFSYGFSPTDPVDTLYRDRKLLQSRDLDAFISTLAALPLRYAPGTRWHYSVAVDVTGAIVERISGQRFDVFLRERLFQPLDMHDTFFEVPADKRDRFGTNHTFDPAAGTLTVLETDGFARYEGTTLFSGGAGLVSTARDYARFAEMLRAGGALGDVRILGPKTVAFMTRSHLRGSLTASGSGERPSIGSLGGYSGTGFGLGVAVVEDVAASSTIGSVGEFSWGGAAGTVFWVDPVEDLVVVGMIQLMRSPWPLREELKALTYQALTTLHEPE